MDTNLTCKKHPQYQAIRKPRADCKPCRGMYADAQRNREAKAAR